MISKSKSLFVRLALAGAMGSLLSVFALGAYVAYEQGELATQSAHRESYLITTGLATALASDLIIKNYGGIDQTIFQFTTHLNLDSFLVATAKGNVIVEARWNVKSESWELFHGGTVELPVKIGVLPLIQGNHIVTWAPINAGNVIGWVRSDMPMDQITATQHKILEETVFVAILAVVLSMLVVVIALHRPIEQLRRATEFAGILPEKHGQVLKQVSSVSELQHLFSALNTASEKLHKQDQELKMLNTLIEYSEDPIYIIDVEDDFRMVFANDAACRHYGVSRERLLSLRVTDWDTEIDSAKLATFWLDIKQNGHLTFYSKHLVAGGDIVPVEVSANYIRYAGREFIAGFFRDIRERVKVEQELRESRDLAEQVARSKTEFLANMSHEIRTPMNGIIGLAQLALNLPTDPDLRDYLSKIYTSSHSLLSILNDILDFSKLEAGRMTIEHNPFDLDLVLDNLRNLFEEGANAKQLDFIIEIDPDTPRNLIGDAMRIQQIISNLLGNAIKFSEHGYVAIRIGFKKHETGGIILGFIIQDTGIGIAKEDLNKLFQPFSQIDGSVTRKFGGTGLGLSISQSLLRLMGGEFSISSQPNRGTSIRFELELDLAVQGSVKKISYRARLKEGELAQDLQKAGFNLQGIRVLMAEDNRINQKVVSEFLKFSGVEVFIANNGQEALDLLEQQEFDVILMDVQMPVMDGIEATRIIRTQTKYANLPIIALTAGVTQEEQESYYAVGMNDFVPKPVNPQMLITCLNNWVAKGEKYSNLEG